MTALGKHLMSRAWPLDIVLQMGDGLLWRIVWIVMMQVVMSSGIGGEKEIEKIKDLLRSSTQDEVLENMHYIYPRVVIEKHLSIPEQGLFLTVSRFFKMSFNYSCWFRMCITVGAFIKSRSRFDS